ncbi:serine protein kinase RIO [Microlunatus flavus]|uniref:non-specific serine/threonine protein kinase n=1 Tax=Microlunatus flavus TaxID=1036181 RepID=A0A1H9DKC4_9ACTN|nr:RIO1 family regulatory kinase/ATPase [Microlunatus flavus]SEQ13935.1 RIO kinase 1 [Microlunatus flavus]
MSSDPNPLDPRSSDLSAPDPFDPRGLSFTAVDEPGPGQRWSTWHDVVALSRGPEPRPGWVVTTHAAWDTDLGPLKSGKEADCRLLERAVPGSLPGDTGSHSLLVAKTYRDAEHRLFHRKATYVEGRRTRNSRDARAAAKGTRHGQAVAAGQWAGAEWEALYRLWQLGVPVPYPVQVDGLEILMEYVHVDGDVAPRLASTRPEPDLLRSVWEQLIEAMGRMAAAGLVHGDLSPYNLLLAGDRLVVIDVPQMVDLVANPLGFDLLHRDCVNAATWFVRRGLPVDADALFAELVATAY